MAGGPVARADFLVSSETAGLWVQRKEKNACPTGSPARLRGNGGGIGNGAYRLVFVLRRRAGARTTEQFVQPFGVDLAAEKIWFRKNAAEKTGVGLDAGNRVFLRARRRRAMVSSRLLPQAMSLLRSGS